MATKVIEDDGGVIITPHASLVNHCALDKLERDVYDVLAQEGGLPLSAIWKRFGCHLWEVNYVLKRLKEKGLLEERNLS